MPIVFYRHSIESSHNKSSAHSVLHGCGDCAQVGRPDINGMKCECKNCTSELCNDESGGQNGARHKFSRIALFYGLLAGKRERWALCNATGSSMLIKIQINFLMSKF